MNAKYNSPGFVDDSLRRAYSDYDVLEEDYQWQKLHKKFQCCGVDGALDFYKDGKPIPEECFKHQGLLYYRLNTTKTHNTTLKPKPPENVVESGCRTALVNRLIIDRYIIGSVSVTCGLLILLTLITGFFILFEEEEEREVGDCGFPSDIYDPCDLNDYYEYSSCQPPPPTCTTCTCQCRTKVCQPECVTVCPKPPCQSCPAPTPSTTAIHVIQGGGQAQVPICPPQAPNSPPVCLVVLPPNGQAPAQYQPPVQTFVPPQPQPQVVPVIQEQTRPLQLQIPDMGYEI